MMLHETSVLTVSLLEPCEVTFKDIGRGSDHGIVKITEHIRVKRVSMTVWTMLVLPSKHHHC